MRRPVPAHGRVQLRHGSIPFIMGITLAMEEQNADNDEFDASAISTIKVALMGPLAGIGDAFFGACSEWYLRVSACPSR